MLSYHGNYYYHYYYYYNHLDHRRNCRFIRYDENYLNSTMRNI